MATEITVPTLGESVTEATVAKWFKAVGDAVDLDEPLVELETDKVTLEINAATAGVLSEIKVDEGSDVEVGAILGLISEASAQASSVKVDTAKADAPKAAPPPADSADAAPFIKEPDKAPSPMPLAPAVRKLIDENALEPSTIPATGKDGRLTKGDVLAYLEAGGAPETVTEPAVQPPATMRPAEPREERVRMTRLRKRIAERLKEAQNTAAMLTTFNEVDMTGVMTLREKYRDAFEKKHNVRIGFMSFFVKACIAALKEIPAVNAEIDGDDIVYKNYYDIGVAVGTPQGLVVPVLRDTDRMSHAAIELNIRALGQKARDGALTMEDLSGGTFTISNGGVYGSLLSTPILNPPQSGILGMHKIQPRPIAVGGSVEVRPMMYLALSYDHRVIDGREAVTFLVRVKEMVEDPERQLLDV